MVQPASLNLDLGFVTLCSQSHRYTDSICHAAHTPEIGCPGDTLPFSEGRELFVLSLSSVQPGGGNHPRLGNALNKSSSWNRSGLSSMAVTSAAQQWPGHHCCPFMAFGIPFGTGMQGDRGAETASPLVMMLSGGVPARPAVMWHVSVEEGITGDCAPVTVALITKEEEQPYDPQWVIVTNTDKCDKRDGLAAQGWTLKRRTWMTPEEEGTTRKN